MYIWIFVMMLSGGRVRDDGRFTSHDDACMDHAREASHQGMCKRYLVIIINGSSYGIQDT